MSLPLLHSPAQILRVLLLELSDGTSPSEDVDWPIYVSAEPDQPDNCITLYDTTPQDDGRAMFDGETWHHHGIQVRVRATDHPTGWVKAEALHTSLDEDIYRNTVTLDAATYTVSGVYKTLLLILGKDSPRTKRSLFTINCFTSITRES